MAADTQPLGKQTSLLGHNSARRRMGAGQLTGPIGAEANPHKGYWGASSTKQTTTNHRANKRDTICAARVAEGNKPPGNHCPSTNTKG